MGLGREWLMARITFKNQSAYFLRLQALESRFAKESTIEKAVYAGSAIVADAIRENLEALPEEQFRLLDTFWGDFFSEVPTGQKKDLIDSFGLTPIERDKNGFVYTKAGFDGYGSFPTNTYPYGVPNALIARAVESGSSIRDKTPFVRPAVNATRKDAIAAMEEVVDDELKKIFNGG